ncbi:MAG: hypothetical protein HYR96_14225 [Deltaproteobacteria bacterium]|nr:hypothetical protein [Deltaproteobacteria bacterium]MBI3296407.1 hypothetical protein [Deltaproteobacteria bacterium]
MSQLLGTPPTPTNVVKVNFVKQAPAARSRPLAIDWLDRFDAGNPWVMRLLAVMLIVLLSLLMI